MIPGLSGRLEELKKQLKELVAKQKQTDGHIRKVRDQIRNTERLQVIVREKMKENTANQIIWGIHQLSRFPHSSCPAYTVGTDRLFYVVR